MSVVNTPSKTLYIPPGTFRIQGSRQVIEVPNEYADEDALIVTKKLGPGGTCNVCGLGKDDPEDTAWCFLPSCPECGNYIPAFPFLTPASGDDGRKINEDEESDEDTVIYSAIPMPAEILKTKPKAPPTVAKHQATSPQQNQTKTVARPTSPPRVGSTEANQTKTITPQQSSPAGRETSNIMCRTFNKPCPTLGKTLPVIRSPQANQTRPTSPKQAIPPRGETFNIMCRTLNKPCPTLQKNLPVISASPNKTSAASRTRTLQEPQHLNVTKIFEGNLFSAKPYQGSDPKGSLLVVTKSRQKGKIASSETRLPGGAGPLKQNRQPAPSAPPPRRISNPGRGNVAPRQNATYTKSSGNSPRPINDGSEEEMLCSCKMKYL